MKSWRSWFIRVKPRVATGASDIADYLALFYATVPPVPGGRSDSSVLQVLGLADVEEVAEGVAEEVDREDGDHDEEAREAAEPPGAGDEAAGIGQLP